MKFFKKISIGLFLLMTFLLQGQTYLKANAGSALLLIPNIGIETSVGKKTTLQFDVLASFWKSINGRPFELYILVGEYRYHFKEKYNGFYVGANLGFDSYDFTKWNYYDLKVHQVGVGVMAGATIGYQKKLNERWMIDVYLGGGSHQGYYHSYYIETGKRFEEDVAMKRNKSGELLPYRAAVMFSYKLN